MRTPWSASAPLSAPAEVDYFLRSVCAGALPLQSDVAPLVTCHGWRGTRHLLSLGDGQHLVAGEFSVADEHAVVYARVRSAEVDEATSALRSTVPFFRDNQTLAQLLAVPGSEVAAPLPALREVRSSLFAKMRRTWTVDGVAFDLAAAPEAGRVEVRFAVAPRPAMADLISARSTSSTTISAHRGATLGGEHYALAYLTDGEVERAIGAVYGDRHCAVIDGTYRLAGPGAEFPELIARLVLELPLRGCPALRARQVVHEVPEGWAVRTRDLTTHLIAPDGKTYMTVLPVEPRQDTWTTTKKLLYEDVISGAQLTTPITCARHVTPHGLNAELVTVKGVSAARRRPFALANAFLSDARYRYVVRYEDRRKAYEAEFARLVSSIEPVPVPARRSGLAMAAVRRAFPVD